MLPTKVTAAELRQLFDALSIEAKVNQGLLGQVEFWVGRRGSSRVVEYVLPNNWKLARAHQWLKPDRSWSKPDPKWLHIEDVTLYVGR